MKLEYSREVDKCMVSTEDYDDYSPSTIISNTSGKKRGDKITNIITVSINVVQSFVTVPEMSYLVTRSLNTSATNWNKPLLKSWEEHIYAGDKDIELRYNTDNGWIFMNIIFMVKLNIPWLVDGINQDGQPLNEEETILAEDIATSIEDVHHEYLGIIFKRESPYRAMVAGKQYYGEILY